VILAADTVILAAEVVILAAETRVSEPCGAAERHRLQKVARGTWMDARCV
jgi:hypothetical protein